MSDDKSKALDAQLDALLGDIDKMRDRIIDMKRKLAAENPVRDVLEFFSAKWVERWARGQAGAKYEFVRPNDPAQVKRLLKTMTVDTLNGRIARFFQDRDEWLQRAKHPFGAFVKGINKYQPEANLRPRPAGCRHDPPCADDVAHTDRMAADLRSGF